MRLFDPESKFMYYLGITGDLIILNVIYALCCIPIVTIGAAQAGLYTGLRNVTDRDGDKTPTKSFFKGFKNGFLKITVIWLIFLVAILLLGYSIYFIYVTKIDAKIPAIVAIVGCVLLFMLFSQIAMFHSKFDCTKMQLVRNGIIMTFAFPLKSVIITALVWLPVGMALINTYILFWGAPLWLGIYFSFAFLISSARMEVPYKKIENPDYDEKEEKRKRREQREKEKNNPNKIIDK